MLEVRAVRVMKSLLAFVLSVATVACGDSASDDGLVDTVSPAADTAATADIGPAEDTSTGDDATTATDVASSEDATVAADTEAPMDAASPVDTPTPGDVAVGTDTVGPDVPPAGALGGPCDAGDTCAEGTCETVPGGAEKVCTKDCLSNYDCPAALRCEAVSVEAMRCLAGPRGVATLGQPCGDIKGLGCVSGLCVDADPAADLPVDTCTEPCTADSACTFPFPVCFAFVDLCLPIPSGSLGGRCKSSGGCDEGSCTPVAGVGDRCTTACSAASECGQAYLTCTAIGAENWCLPKAAGE